MRFMLAYWAERDDFLMAAKKFKRLGGLNIGSTVSGLGGSLPEAYYAAYESGAASFHFPIDINQDVFFNFDSMHHQQKGAVGLFIQQTNGATVENVDIENVKNYGDDGSNRVTYKMTPFDADPDPNDFI